MNKNLKLIGYNITSDPYFSPGSKVPLRLQPKLAKLHKEALQKNNKEIIAKLKALIKEYPEVPVLKNYLSVAYNTQGLQEEAFYVNKQIVEQHPDYLYGKLNEANYYLNNKMPEKVPELLGKEMELKSLCPHRDTFHFSEVTAFLSLAIRYFCTIGNLEQAQIRLDILEKLAPGEPQTEAAEDMVESLVLQQNIDRLAVSIRRNKREPAALLPKQTDQAPRFHHAAMQDLYEYGFDLPKEKIQEILALPRKTLVEDLNKVLEDGLRRLEFFEQLNWEENNFQSVLHAIFFLGELKATESLPNVLDFLKQDEDVLDFWLGDHITESVWRYFYSLGMAGLPLPVIKPFLLNPAVNVFARSSVLQAFEQMLLHLPETRKEISGFLTEVLTSIHTLDPDQVDPEFNGFLIDTITISKFEELMPLVKQLFEADAVAEDITGTYQEVETEIANPENTIIEEKIYSIKELYDHFQSGWLSSANQPSESYEFDDDFEDDDDFKEGFDIDAKLEEIFKSKSFGESTEPVKRTDPKVGRNDPCQCGSGKKYKKCCG